MRIKRNEEDLEVFVEPEERDSIQIANKNLKDLIAGHKEINIESIIKSNLALENYKLNRDIINSIGASLGAYIGSETAAFLLNILVNPIGTKILLNKLKEEGLIAINVSDLILELSAKYAAKINAIFLANEFPNDWVRINSSELIDANGLKLQSRICKRNGDVFEFNMPIKDSALFADHFIRRSLDILRRIDKEAILDIDINGIETLRVHIEELLTLAKEVRADVESRKVE
jgi:hypothetical protein